MKRQYIYLVGFTKNQILGSKLPSQRDCMRVLFYNMRFVKMSLAESAKLVIDECLIFWKKARIPLKDVSDCVKKLKKLYETWRNLEKSKNRESEVHKNKVNKFEANLDAVFDIGHQNALEYMTIVEDKEFLISQRKPGRPGCMLGVDMRFYNTEKRKNERMEREVAKKQKYESELSKYTLGNY